MAQEEPAFDAIVVGSGITGGWAAKELTEAGLRDLALLGPAAEADIALLPPPARDGAEARTVNGP